MKIVADANIPYVEDYFRPCGDLILIPGRHITHADVKEADMLLVRSITQVNKQLLANTSVKFVGSITAGKDHLDTDFLEEAGIEWSLASGFNAPPVADYVISVIAALQKKQLLTSEQKRVAVIGLGQVGELVAKQLTLLGMEVVPCDPIRASNETDFVSVSIDKVVDVDLITLHVPLTYVGEHATLNLLNQSILKRQRPGCILLNASRGAVIGTHDLLTAGGHLYWCLDVFEHEPHVDKYLVQQATIVTPHIAGYSVQSKMRGVEMIYAAACQSQLITQTVETPLTLPRQQLAFAGINHQWQDIVLGIFNPLLLTTMMRSLLLPAKEHGELFDQMRNQFNDRHEFGYTTVQADIVETDKKLLRQLGVTIQQG